MSDCNLYPHQIEAIEFHSKRKYSICGYEPGLGKSLIAIKLAERFGLKTLIIVPAYLKHNWNNEIDKFSTCKHLFSVESYSIFTKLIQQKIQNFKEYKFIVFDEAHFLKSHDAKRTKAAHSFVSIMRPDRLLLLTGTPIVNRVAEFHSLLKLCFYSREFDSFLPFDNFYKFAMAFSHIEKYQISGRTIVKYFGVKNPEVLRELIRPVYIRKKTKDVLNLPEQVISYIGDNTIRDFELEQAYDKYLGDGQMAHFSSAKAVNALAKVKQTVQFVQDTITDNKVVIFSDHVQAAQEIAVGLDCEVITGQTSINDRAEIIKKFLDKDQYLVATIGALSTGVNLQVANYMVFNDVCFVPGQLEQAMKRIHRIGTKETCFYYFMVISKIDEQIIKTLNEKKDTINQVL